MSYQPQVGDRVRVVATPYLTAAPLGTKGMISMIGSEDGRPLFTIVKDNGAIGWATEVEPQ